MLYLCKIFDKENGCHWERILCEECIQDYGDEIISKEEVTVAVCKRLALLEEPTCVFCG